MPRLHRPVAIDHRQKLRGAQALRSPRSPPAAAAQDHDPVAHAQQLRQVARRHDDARPRRTQPPDHAVDVGPRAHIDAARRLIQKRQARRARRRLGRKPPSAGSPPKASPRSAQPVVFQPHLAAARLGLRPFGSGARPHTPQAAEPCQMRQNHVGRDTPAQHQPLAPPFPRDIGDAALPSPRRRNVAPARRPAGHAPPEAAGRPGARAGSPTAPPLPAPRCRGSRPA
jgi:hypothetical protein